MRKLLLLGAAALAMPVALGAQSTSTTGQTTKGQTTSGQTAPDTGQPGVAGSANERADSMGDTANPIASDTHMERRSGMGSAQAGSADSTTYPTCSRTVTDHCRNRGGR